jgi:hypothetical protein
MSKSKTAGEGAFGKMEKVSAELFALTYGATVTQLLRDHGSPVEVNAQLERMGHASGMRLVEEFLARSGTGRCSDLREAAAAIARTGFRMFLGVSASAGSFAADGTEFSLQFDENPLAEFVQLPPGEVASTLWYSNIICGVIRGGLEMVHWRVECFFVRDVLRGDETNEIRVVLKERIGEELVEGYAD